MNPDRPSRLLYLHSGSQVVTSAWTPPDNHRRDIEDDERPADCADVLCTAF